MKNSRNYLNRYSFLYIISIILVFLEPSTSFATEKIDLSDSNPSWIKVFNGEFVLSPIKTSYGFATLEDGKTLCAFEENGNILWQKGFFSRNVSFLASAQKDFLYSVTNNSVLSLINPSGNVLWKVNSLFNITQCPFSLQDGRVLIQGKENISCLGINGIIKWDLKTERQSDIQVQELNDGSLLIFLEELKDGKTVGIRLSPFGEVIEKITFLGVIKKSIMTSAGIVLIFDSGKTGLLSVNEKTKETYTSWVNENLVLSEDFLFNITEKQIDFLFLNNSTYVLCSLDLKTGKEVFSFSLNEINDKPISLTSIDGKYLITTSTTCAFYLTNGECFSLFTLPKKNGNKPWNYVLCTESGYLIFCTKAWSLYAYKVYDTPKTKMKKINLTRKTYRINNSSLYFSDYDFDARRVLLQKGFYAEKEKQLILETNFLIDSYIENSENDEGSFFESSYKLSTFISTLPLYGIKEEYVNIARLLQNEKDSSIKIALLKAIQVCGYDEDGSVMDALEYVLENTNIRQNSVLKELCKATYSVCSFMGRPSLYEKGQKIISHLLLSQYDTDVKREAQKTFDLILKLKL